MTEWWLCDVAGCTYEGTISPTTTWNQFVLCAHHAALPRHITAACGIKPLSVPYPTPRPRSRRLTVHREETP